MECVTKSSMLEILLECLKDSNPETVSKAELRKKYLEKTGVNKLPHEDKEMFASAVNTAYLNYIGNKTATADIADETKIDEASDDKIKENSKDWKLIMSSSSDEDITPENIKENVINDQFTNGENDIKETSGDEIKENSEHEKLLMDSSPCDNISPGKIQEIVIADQSVNGVNDIEMESSSDFDEKSLSSHTKNINKKSPLASTLNGFKRQRGKRTLISSSEDETIQLKPTKKHKVLQKDRRSSDLEEQPITKSEEKKKVLKNIKNQNRFKKAMIESSDSEDELLSVFQKKSNSLSRSLNSLTKSDESENECSSKVRNKQFRNPVDYEGESIMSSTKKNTKSIDDSKNHSSDSEDEPLIIIQKSNNSIQSNGEKMKFETRLKSNGSQDSMKLKINSSDSEDEHLSKYRNCNDSIHSDNNSNSFSKKKLNSANKFSQSIESTSGSEDESLVKYSKKKVDNSIDSSDSEDEPLNNLSHKKIDNSYDSIKKPSEKTLKGKVKHFLKKPLTFSSKSKEETLKKKRFIDSDDDSDEQPIATLAKKSDPVNSSLKSVKNSIDSEDDPLNNLSNKKTDNSNNSEIEPVGKNGKGKGKHSLKKPITKNNKSKEETLKKKGFVDSNDDANISNRKKGKFLDGQRCTLLSDSYEDEPLSSIKRGPNNFSDSEDDAKKKEKSFNEQKSSLLIDSGEDESLSNIKKEANSSSDSEDESLNKLSTKKSDKKRKNSESGSSSFIDENEKQSSKKNKPSKRKDANDSGKEKKRPSASENKIEHLKKYLRVAGIRISNYNKLFENCKNTKAKCEKMMSLLEKEGLKGRPTIEKCKKLRVKIETKREIAELDVSNILKEGGGRPKRSVCSDTTNCKREEKKSTPVKKFSRLQDIVDSEESD